LAGAFFFAVAISILLDQVAKSTASIELDRLQRFTARGFSGGIAGSPVR
jgi:hypothetical protein